MRDDEIRDRLKSLESRVDILEGNPVREKPKAKPKVEEKPKQEPKTGTTTEPFNPESEGAPKPAELPEGVEEIVKQKAKMEAEDKGVFKDEQITKVKASLDIDALDKHLSDEALKDKYGDRVEEAKKLIAELDNDKA